jgi:hypothetical protein
MDAATPAATTEGKMARSASAAACALGLPPAQGDTQCSDDSSLQNKQLSPQILFLLW